MSLERMVRMVTATDNDRLVAATLAAAKAAKADLTKPIDYVLEYERIRRVILGRKGRVEQENANDTDLTS